MTYLDREAQLVIDAHRDQDHDDDPDAAKDTTLVERLFVAEHGLRGNR